MGRQQLNNQVFIYLICMNKKPQSNKNNIIFSNKGFSIIEIIIYFSLLGIISILVTDNIITLFKNYNIVRANQEIEYNAISILDKLNKDAHEADNVILGQSSFSVPHGIVALKISSSTNGFITDTKRFYLENGKMNYYKNGVYFGNLSTKNVNISNFKINYITGTTTEALKVELSIESNPHLNSSIISKNFYTTIQLH
jgi:type II secretory pathway pseudopilin PulG